MAPAAGSPSGLREHLVDLLARHTGVAAADVDPAEPFWKHFPPNYGNSTHPVTVAFIADVQRSYPVFLTEAEWEEPSVNDLAEIITAKLEDPQLSARDRRAERVALRKGTIQGLVVFNLLLLAVFWLDDRKWASGTYVWYAAAFALLNGGLLYAFWREGEQSWPPADNTRAGRRGRLPPSAA